MRVLLAVDLSKGSQLAVDDAAARPWPTRTEFVALHVVELAFDRFPTVIEGAKREARKLVEAAAGKLVAAGHKCETEVIVGTPRTAISQFAKDWKADFVMLGSHGHGAIGRFLLGSVAQGVLRTASCSVEVVHRTRSGSPASRQALKILLPTDGSEFSLAAAKSVASRPWPAGTQIKVLSVEEIPVFENETAAFPLAAVYPASLLDELIASAHQHAREAEESTKRIFAGTDLKIVDPGSLPVGDPRLIILEQAECWPADLVVLGSHGRRGLDRVLMGSVSETVALHADCSVEVIRLDRQEAENTK
jgi:nucleotide-binding universal stress UspA family protein